MRALRVLSAAFALVLAGASPPQTQLFGYSLVGSDRERALETQFVDIPSADGALDTVAALAAQPHPPGSRADYQSAVAMRDQLAQFGFAATIETLTARVDTPKHLALALYPGGRAQALQAQREAQPHALFRLPPLKHRRAATPAPATLPAAAASPDPSVGFDLHEPALAADPDTANPDIGLPYLAGSADGDVVAPLVYAGHGGDADYALLAAHKIDVRGTIVLVRNGREFRGITARRAQAHGVAGAIFYDDPADDGVTRGAAYPFGPYRPATSVRRGTVGEGVTIPVLPVSAATAQTLLGALHGPSAGTPWTGALAVGYPFARGPATVHLAVQLARKPATLWNAIGVLPGEHPEQTVVVGAHRDAWVFGASDDGSGIATVIEAARGLGYLAKSGYRPTRSIVVAGWDGEELGAYGTIAYVKKHDAELRQGGVAYLDAEQSVTGARFGADAAAAIAPAVADATHMIPNPAQPGTTVYDTWGFRSRTMPSLALAGSGGDVPPSLFGVGMPSANAGFGGVLGVYHSSYDTILYAKTFGDPGFAMHRAAAQLVGVIAMRLADAQVVPYQFGTYAPLLRGAVRALGATAKATKTHVDAAGLGQSIARFGAAARRFDAATQNLATESATARALDAARILDVVLYGNDGYRGGAVPELAHAVGAGDQGDVDRATARTRAAIDRAADLLAI